MKRTFTLIIMALMLMMTSLAWGQARTTVTDQLTRDLTGVTGNNYASWSGVTSNSPAVYAGQSAGGNNSIQLRSNNNNSGIITTTTGGTVTNVTVTWNSATASGRTLNIYGKDTAYESPSDLYNSDTQGTLIGTIVNGTSTSLDISDSYAYIGMRSASSAMYLAEIDITWSTGGTQPTVAAPTFSPAGGTYTEAQNVTISCTTDGATIYYTLDGNNPTTSSAVYSSPIAISETTTVKAMAVKSGMSNSNIATATYTIQEATTITTIEGLWEFANSVGTTQTTVTVAFNDWYVSGVKGTNQATITDGQFGFVIYQNGHGFTIGDKLNGTVTCTALKYQNHYAELMGVTASALTVTSGQEVPGLTTTIDALEVRNYGTPINLGTLTYNGTTFVDASSNTIAPYNNFNISPNPITSLEADKEYNVKGVYIVYWQSGNPVKQVAPRSADDFEEVLPPPTPTYYNVSIAEGITNGTVTVDPTSAEAGETITVTATPDSNYELETLTYFYEGAGGQIDIDQTTMQFAMPAADATVSATFSEIVPPTPPATMTFTKIDNHTDVTSDGTYMIVDVNGGYALTSANGSSSLPAAVAVTIEDNTITGDIDEALQWKFTAVEGGYTISPVNNGEVFLYTTNANNGVRVGTNTNNVWELDITDANKPNYHGFKNVAFTRYIGVYNNSTWRTYTSISANIENTQIEIFVLGSAPVPPTPPTTAVATPTFTPAAGTYITAQEVTIACATEGATIHYTTDGTEPTTESDVYIEPFTVSATTTVKAMAVKEGMLDSQLAMVEYTIIEPVTIAAARVMEVNEYALVEGVVTFIDGRNVYVQDETAGICLFLNNNTVPSTLALGDLVMGYGKVALYNGLVELSGINGGNANQFVVVSNGNELPLALKTIAEILADHEGIKMLQSTRVQIVDATCGTINNSGNTPITQDESTLNIYKLPVVEGLEEGDLMTVTGVVGCFTNPQLRVAAAADVAFTHPAGITVSPAALSGFNYVYEQGPSAVQTFTITGRSLTAPTYIHASENYEISSFPGESFYPENTITINTYTGTYSYVIKVRLKAGLEVGTYNESLVINQADVEDIDIVLSGSVTGEPPQPQPSDYTRISDISQLTSGAKVIFAARYNEVANEYYAMTAQASGKPEGVLFTSVESDGETLPTSITDVEETFYWTVDVDGGSYTFTNANGDVLGYTSSTNFSPGGDNTAWAITFQTSEATAMVPEYSAFVINNVNNPLRAIALNSNHNYGPYHTQNIASESYNFFIDMFATVGGGTLTCATPTFTPQGGSYYEAQEVSIGCSTVGATIYYTTDGSDPDENSEVYTEPMMVETSMALKAIAMKEGYENSNIAEAQYIIILDAVTIFSQDWEGEMNGWTFVTVEGGNAWTIATYNNNHYAYANGYNGGVNEQWCISPAFNLYMYTNASLSFRNAMNYNGPDMQLYFSNDYDGENPATATWTELEFNKSTGSYAWTESGNIDLSDYTGESCYIGFKYTSTETAAAAWEVDDITLMGFTTEPYLTVTPNALSGFTYIVGNGPSAAQTFTVSGGNLPPAPGETSGGVDISISNSNFELSLDGEVYSHNLSIEVVGTLEPTTVYVRLEAGLPVYQYIGMIFIEDAGITTSVSVIGDVIEEPVPGNDWNRIYALSDLHDGDQVILASRYDATVGDGYYAMPAVVSGKPDGVLFTSVNDGGVEKLPAEISGDADTYMWNVIMDGDVITLVNAAGDSLGYSSNTNFSGNVQTEWNIALETAGEGAMIPNYTGFVITNGETTNRGIAKNASNKFGAYAISNMNSSDYNFYLDLFVQGGSVTPTVATPIFSMAAGTYYEVIEVEITCATEGATIHYTTDGSDPTEDSEVYAEPIVVDSDMTIKAIAMLEGYDNSVIATASYVIITDVVVLLNQDWEGEMNGWTFVTVEGNKPWFIGTYAGNKYANANGYGDDVDNEQWCISPAFNLSNYAGRDVTLTFMNATKFDGPALELYFSNNYNGQDPGDADWTELTFTMSEGNYTWTESGEISLNSFSGENCYIGFRYISTVEDGAAAWEVDDIMVVVGDPVSVFTPEAALNADVWNSHNELMISNNSSKPLSMVVYNLVGQPVLSETVATGSNAIRHNLAEGVYIVRLSDGKEVKGVKVVVRR